MLHDCIQENRISKLERETAVNNTNIVNAIKSIDNLTSEVKWLVRIVVGVLIACVGFLLKSKLGW